MAQVPSNLIPSTVTQLAFAPEASAEGLLLYTLNGVSYKIRAGDLLQVAGVPTSRQVIAGTGLQGGGALSSNVTLSVAPGGIGSTQLATTGVAPGTYGSGTQVPVLTVDATGRVTAASNTPLTISGYVPESRQVIAGPGLTGGGPLNNNVTLAANFSSANPLALSGSGSAGVAVTMSRADHRHPAVNLGVDDEVDGVLGLSNGGTAKSLVPAAGAIVWSGADGLYIGSVGQYGQVLASGGTGQYIWANVVAEVPRPANTVWAGPTTGPDAIPTFRALVNADIPSTLSGKTITSANIAGSTINSTTIGGSSPSTAVFTTVDATTGNLTTVNATTVDTTNLEVTNLNAKDGTAAGSIADATGVVTLNSAVLTTADINGGTADNVVIGAAAPAAATFTSVNANYLQLNTTLSPVPTAVGSVYWDGGTTVGVQATANVVIRVGESEYVYAKASAPITKGQLCYHTGSVGSSGVITVAPTPLALTDPNQIVGVAAETLALNGFGLIQISGDLRGFNTTGSGVGETWVDGDPLYYNPAHVGGLTNVKPSAPNQKSYIGEVVNASNAGSGSIHIRIVPGSVLGGTDSNVQFGTLSDKDLIQYDNSLKYWKNVAASSIAIGTATNLAGGATGSVPYQTAAATTGMLAIGTAAQVLKVNSGATAPEWVSGATLSKTDDTNVTLTLGGSPTTALLAATSLTLGWTGELSTARGGTGLNSYTAGDLPYYAAGTALSKLGIGTNGQILTSSGTAPQWTNGSSITVGTATNAVNTGITDDTSTAATVYPTWVTANTGNLPQKVSSTKLTFNPSTGVLTATGGIGGGVF